MPVRCRVGLDVSKITNNVRLGNSTTAMSAAYTDKALQVYTTCPSTDASTSYEPVYISTVMTGAGQVGGRVRINMETNVALGAWANAFKASVDCKTSGRATGLLSVGCFEITMPASAGGAGTYSVVETEVVCPASWTGTNNVSMFYCAASGSTVANWYTYGYLFDLVGFGDAATGKVFSANNNTADHALRIRVDNVSYWILLANASD